MDESIILDEEMYQYDDFSDDDYWTNNDGTLEGDDNEDSSDEILN